MDNINWEAVARSLAQMYDDAAECDDCEVTRCPEPGHSCADSVLDYGMEETQKGV